MRSAPTKRLLPLLDVMMLLFGFLLIVLLAAEHRRQQGSDAGVQSAEQLVVESLLAGRPLAVFEVAADRESSVYLRAAAERLPMGSAAAPLAEIASHVPDDGLAIVLAPEGLKGRHFDERRQERLLEALGSERCVILVDHGEEP